MLAALAARDFAIVEEPGRRIVKSELAGDGVLLPWNNMIGFARSALELALDDHRKAKDMQGAVFFDRGIIDAAAVLVDLAADQAANDHLKTQYYNRNVFLAPPWPEIFVQDKERRHSFGDAVAEYERLLNYYSEAGYLIHILPKTSVAERVEFVIDTLAM